MRPDEDRRLVDPAGGSGRVDVDEQIRVDPPGQVDQSPHDVGMAREIDPDAALAPDDQVHLLVCQSFGDRFAGPLTFRGGFDGARLHQRHPDRRTDRGLRSPDEPRRTGRHAHRRDREGDGTPPHI